MNKFGKYIALLIFVGSIAGVFGAGFSDLTFLTETDSSTSKLKIPVTYLNKGAFKIAYSRTDTKTGRVILLIKSPFYNKLLDEEISVLSDLKKLGVGLADMDLTIRKYSCPHTAHKGKLCHGYEMMFYDLSSDPKDDKPWVFWHYYTKGGEETLQKQIKKYVLSAQVSSQKKATILTRIKKTITANRAALVKSQIKDIQGFFNRNTGEFLITDPAAILGVKAPEYKEANVAEIEVLLFLLNNIP